MWLAVFVVRCCQMTLARCYFADFADRTWPSRQRLVRSWPIALKPTIHAYANVMPIVLFQVSHLTNVGPTWFQVTSLLYVLYCTTCMNEALRKKRARKQTRTKKRKEESNVIILKSMKAWSKVYRFDMYFQTQWKGILYYMYEWSIAKERSEKANKKEKKKKGRKKKWRKENKEGKNKQIRSFIGSSAFIMKK